MRIVIVIIVLAVAFILGVMCANVVFVAKCSSIRSRIASASFPLVNSSTEAATGTIQVENAFSRGEIIVSAANSTTGSMNIEFFGSDVGAKPIRGHKFLSDSDEVVIVFAAGWICCGNEYVQEVDQE